MKYFFIGFLAAFAGFVVSPQFNFSSKILVEIDYVVRCSAIIGGLVGLFSNICGHDHRMWRRSRLDFIVNVVVAALIGLFISIVFFYIFRIIPVGRWVLVLSFCFYVLLVVLLSARFRFVADSKVFLYGDGAKLFFDLVSSSKLKLVVKNKTRFEVCQSDGRGDLLIINSGLAHQCYIVPDGEMSSDLESVVLSKGLDFAQRVVSLNYMFEREYECVNIDAETAKNWWEIETPFRRAEFINLKRFIDLVLLAVFGLPAIIVIGAVGIVIRIIDGGPIFYRQTRLGQFRRPFSMFKIRTMVVDSEQSGVQWAQVGDSRVTRFGRILRLTRFDELPQLWNILCGDMSFIGPRPERPEFFAIIEKECPKFGLRLVCKPGITGWAQVNCPYGASVDDSIVKLMYDIFYIKNASILMEVRILIRTVLAMIKGAR